MNMSEVNVLYSLVIVALVVSNILLVVLGIFIYRQRSKSSNEAVKASREEVKQDPIQQEVRQEVKALAASLNVLSERVIRIESRLDRVQEREPRPAPANREGGNRMPFEFAIKLALQGADVDELVNLCGLTRSEAELIRSLHRATNAPTSQADEIKKSLFAAGQRRQGD